MKTPPIETAAIDDGAVSRTSRFKPRTDPVTFEVLRHRLWQINDEQGKTIISVSGSPVASEGNDFNVALTNAAGEIVACGPYIVIHVSAISLVVRAAIEMFGEDGIREGDMYLSNDPWLGAGHQNDVSVIQPVFWKGERIAWTASVIHQVDVGGTYPGSWNPKARSVFDEAPRYRLLKVVRDGTLQREVVATYLTNSRFPDLVELDLRAQVAAANVARDRLEGLMRRYGSDIVKNAMEDSLDYSQMLFQQRLQQIPDGQWYAEDHLDHDGHEEKVYTVRCLMSKAGDKLTFDLPAPARRRRASSIAPRAAPTPACTGRSIPICAATSRGMPACCGKSNWSWSPAACTTPPSPPPWASASSTPAGRPPTPRPWRSARCSPA